MNLQAIYRENVLGREMVVYGDNENPLFLAKDVADFIEHSNVSVMLNSIDEEEKFLGQISTLNNAYSAWYLTEEGIYEVLMQSRKPIAKEFKKNVKRILKEIRKTGSYIAPMTTSELILAQAQQLVNQEREIKEIKDKQNVMQIEHNNIKEVLGAQYDNWRKSTNSIINKISYNTNIKQSEIRNTAYSLLEDRAGCRLEQRLNNMKARCLSEKNWSKSKIEKLNILDVIENENKLVQIFVSIVKELAIKYGI